jgi:hypothetical protein
MLNCDPQQVSRDRRGHPERAAVARRATAASAAESETEPTDVPATETTRSDPPRYRSTCMHPPTQPPQAFLLTLTLTLLLAACTNETDEVDPATTLGRFCDTMSTVWFNCGYRADKATCLSKWSSVPDAKLAQALRCAVDSCEEMNQCLSSLFSH